MGVLEALKGGQAPIGRAGKPVLDGRESPYLTGGPARTGRAALPGGPTGRPYRAALPGGRAALPGGPKK